MPEATRVEMINSRHSLQNILFLNSYKILVLFSQVWQYISLFILKIIYNNLIQFRWKILNLFYNLLSLKYLTLTWLKYYKSFHYIVRVLYMIIHVKERSLTCNDARYLASLLISCKFFYFYSLSWNLKVHLEYILYSFYHCWRTAYIEYAFLYIIRI